MMLKKWMRSVVLLLLLTLPIQYGYAQNAYFYIEGDQETPFYVKVEGKMMERLGKNYAIIPNLGAGHTNFEILFEKNKYPAQHFILEVPETGTRGFVLNKVNEKQFALFDIDQKRFIVSGNRAEDDYVLPASIAKSNEEKAFYEKNTPEINAKELLQKYGQTNTQGKAKESNESNIPQFIDEIALNKEGNTNKSKQNIRKPESRKRYTQEEVDNSLKNWEEEEEILKPSKKKVKNLMEESDEEENKLPPIPNTDCPSPMNNQVFENIALRFLAYNDDTQKISYLRKNTSKLCFSTEQVRILASNMETQSGKFEVVKMLYIQTSDQDDYERLVELFNSGYIKSEFRNLLKR